MDRWCKSYLYNNCDNPWIGRPLLSGTTRRYRRIQECNPWKCGKWQMVLVLVTDSVSNVDSLEKIIFRHVGILEQGLLGSIINSISTRFRKFVRLNEETNHVMTTAETEFTSPLIRHCS